MCKRAGRCHAGDEGRSDGTAPPGSVGGDAMSQPKRQSVSRRGFLAGMVATSAAVGAFALSARVSSAAPWPAEGPGEPLASGAPTERQDTDLIAHTSRATGVDTMINQ